MTNRDISEVLAERLEQVYATPEVVTQRADTLAHPAPQPGERILDIGSGPGFLCEALAEAVGPAGRVTGIDIDPAMLALAARHAPSDRLSDLPADATDLQRPCDAAVSVQVDGYLPDIDRFAPQAFRAMRPAGHGLVLATGWDGLV
jgi:ubiquinone/menaquinone biosynthesis C-methylase UbiE